MLNSLSSCFNYVHDHAIGNDFKMFFKTVVFLNEPFTIHGSKIKPDDESYAALTKAGVLVEDDGFEGYYFRFASPWAKRYYINLIN
jgi:hypothetical protein